ncbi:aspartyl protease family protein [Phenylobacterium sp.]|uniref:aspartyl protease family protein n=1 Tax=Phenylobacterium sp. TaxID=1871053 RepID=UPI0037CCBE98
MTTRRALLSRAALLASGAAGVWLVRDRLPWPPLDVRLANGRDTPWMAMSPGGGLIDLTVAVNGVPIRAIVDSGAQMTAVDGGLAHRLGLRRPLTAPMLAFGVSGKPDLTHSVTLHLAMPGLSVSGLHAAALDLAGVSALSGRDFQMLIGRDLLRHLVVEADFPGARVRFLSASAYSPPRDAIDLPLRRRGGAPVVAVKIEDADPVDVLVDTGSSRLLALSEGAARKTGLLSPGRTQGAAHSVNLGGFSLNRIVTARSVRIGVLDLPSVDIQIYRPAFGAGGPEGLLGTGLFRQFRMGLDLGGKRLVLLRPPLRVIPTPG